MPRVLDREHKYSPLRGSWWADHHLDPTCWEPTCRAGPFLAGERGAVHSGRQGGKGDGMFRTQTQASVPACVRGGWGEWLAGCWSLHPQDWALGRTAGMNRDTVDKGFVIYQNSDWPITKPQSISKDDSFMTDWSLVMMNTTLFHVYYHLFRGKYKGTWFTS